jgi:hypothetical protein
MPVDVFALRVAEMADLPIKFPDGSPMVDGDGLAVTASVFGPGTRIWQVAHATMRRKAIKRSREANGKYEAALDNATEDTVDFLCAIIKRFNNFANPDGIDDAALVAKVLNEPLLGYIRDHLSDDASNWENFTKASSRSSNSGSGNLPG